MGNVYTDKIVTNLKKFFSLKKSRNSLQITRSDNEIVYLYDFINRGASSPVNIGGYDEYVLMMMYDDVVIARASDLTDRNFSIL